MSRTTIKDLARELELSVCTINKALTGKKRISEETRGRVLEAAQRMGYRPNRLAQALVRRSVSIGIVYPETWPGFFGPLIEGVKHGLKELQDHNIRVKFFQFSGFSAGDHLAGVMGAFGGKNPDGLIVCPHLGDMAYSKQWNVLVERHIPFIFLGNEVLGAPRLACFHLDGLRCGRMAAELLGQLTGAGPAAILVGRRDFPDHRNKIKGFTEEAGRFLLKVLESVETFDDPKVAYRVTRRLFSEHPEIKGIYVATDNSEGVCRYLIRHGAAEKVKLIVTGVFPEVREMMDQGVVHFTVYQNMERQGRSAVHSLYLYLAEKTAPPDEILVPPVIVMRNNFDLVWNYLAGEPESVG